MTVGSALARGRAAHLKLLIDSCTIRRKTGETLDTATGLLTPAFVVVYAGPCRIKPYRTGRPTTAGDTAVMRRPYEVLIPWDAIEPIFRADRVTVDRSDDPWVTAREMTVAEVNYSGTQTVRHLLVEDIE